MAALLSILVLLLLMLSLYRFKSYLKKRVYRPKNEPKAGSKGNIR